jgi:hypothetical protein
MINNRKDRFSGEDMAEVEIKAGDTFFVPWPFSYVYLEDENTIALLAGFTSFEISGFGTDTVYHVEGKSILTVIGVFTPPGYQTRIFYTRHYHPPAETGTAQLFGSKQLRIKTVSFFKRMLGPGYLNQHRKASEQETLKAIADIKRRIAKRSEEPREPEEYDDSEFPF